MAGSDVVLWLDLQRFWATYGLSCERRRRRTWASCSSGPWTCEACRWRGPPVLEVLVLSLPPQLPPRKWSKPGHTQNLSSQTHTHSKAFWRDKHCIQQLSKPTRTSRCWIFTGRGWNGRGPCFSSWHGAALQSQLAAILKTTATHSVAVLLNHIVGSRGVVVDVHRVFVILTVVERKLFFSPFV